MCVFIYIKYSAPTYIMETQTFILDAINRLTALTIYMNLFFSNNK